MEFIEVLRKRRAVRDFKPDPVPEPLLNRMINAAILAPSAMNAQPWRFTIVTDQSLLQEMSVLAKKFMLAATHIFARPDHFRDLFSDPNLHLFHHAPALVVISGEAGPWVTEDCSLAAQNLMLAACEMSLSTCWIGFTQAWMNTRQGREMLQVPVSEHIVAPVAVGFAKSFPPPVPRKAPSIAWISGKGEPSLFEKTQ